MSKIANMFRAEMSKKKGGSYESSCQVGYPTGFIQFDYRNAMRVTVTDVDTEEELYTYDSIGIPDGSIITFIGLSGTGKTTIAMQMAAHIVDQFEDSVLMHEDAEGTTTRTRFMNVTGWGAKKTRAKYLHRDSGVTTDSFFERIYAHCEMKLDNSKDLTYDTGLVDEFNEPIYKIIPTVVLLDSLFGLMPKKQAESGEMASAAASMQQAKANAQMIKTIRPLLKASNTILMMVNHIQTKIDANPFAPQQAQVNYLRQNETLPGGVTPIYYSNNIIRVKASTKFKPDDGFGYDGFMGSIELVKSKTNKAGQVVSLAYNQETGFDKITSLFVLLKDENKIMGRQPHLYVKGLEEIKFSKKTFTDKFREYPELRRHIKETIMPILETWASSNDGDDEGLDNKDYNYDDSDLY